MDVVVTVPKDLWSMWLEEGDLPGDTWSGSEWHYYMGGPVPAIKPGERVYVTAYGRLRGYAPLVRIERTGRGGFALVRRGNAVACTIPEAIRGFRGFRYRWWDYVAEEPFGDWQNPRAVVTVTDGSLLGPLFSAVQKH